MEIRYAVAANSDTRRCPGPKYSPNIGIRNLEGIRIVRTGFLSQETQVCTSRARFRRLLSEPHVFVCSVATILPQSSTNNLTVTSTDQIHRLAYCTVGLAGNKAMLLSNVISILLSLPAVSQKANLFNYGYESLLRNSRLGGLCNTYRIYNACMRHCDTTSTSLRRRA
jgi:hypothetical protein